MLTNGSLVKHIIAKITPYVKHFPTIHARPA